MHQGSSDTAQKGTSVTLGLGVNDTCPEALCNLHRPAGTAVVGDGYAAVALALILDPSGGLFSDAARPCQRPAPRPVPKLGPLEIADKSAA